MYTLANATVFFDVSSLASVRISPKGDRIVELSAFPEALAVLGALRAEGARLGILSRLMAIPNKRVYRSLQRKGLLRYFEPDLVLRGCTDSPLFLEQAAARARRVHGTGRGTPPPLFVSTNPVERVVARAADFLTAPHPLLTRPVLLGHGPLRYLRIRVPPAAPVLDWRARLQDYPLVPLHLTREPAQADSTSVLYAIGDDRTATKLDALGLWVDRLGKADEPQTTELFLLHSDLHTEAEPAAPAWEERDDAPTAGAARRILASTCEGLVVAIPAGRSLTSYAFPGVRHGHNRQLLAPLEWLEERGAASDARPQSAVDAAPAPRLSKRERKILRQQVVAKDMLSDIERYASFASRHTWHDDNKKAVAALVKDLEGLGGSRLAVRLHPFTYQGLDLCNVEAKLPATVPGREIIIVSAHLDSTSERNTSSQPAFDRAPGADDDASGIAGVLAAARAVLQLAAPGVEHGEIRFVLFNAEETELAGSKAYAGEESKSCTRITAVFQMDMIGFDKKKGRTFELHVGHRKDPNVQERSLELAELIRDLVVNDQVSANLVPQVVPDAENPKDEADGLSDHSSFHSRKIAACLISEDRYPGPGSAPEDGNPQYHLEGDTVDLITPEYAADIARVVAAAAWYKATR
ncbi:MAG TPA: M20/M25/M40 family metallo-hydrolase [Longimicrobium sp.]|jgi:hypothetical protein